MAKKWSVAQVMEHCRRNGITPSECGRRGGLTAAANHRRKVAAAAGTQTLKSDPVQIQMTLDLEL